MKSDLINSLILVTVGIHLVRGILDIPVEKRFKPFDFSKRDNKQPRTRRNDSELQEFDLLADYST